MLPYVFRLLSFSAFSGAVLISANFSARAQPAPVTMEICPENLTNIPMETPLLTCGCSAEAARRNVSIWGANPYMTFSGICRAALHAGAIGAGGGQVSVVPAPKVPFFPSVTRNDIESSSDGAYDGFRIVVATREPQPQPIPVPSPARAEGLRMEICPNTLSKIPMDTPALTCGCSAEAAGRNVSLWGDNPYSTISGICRAARHAGAIGAQGGEVTVTPAPKVPFFPSVTRNDIASASDGAYDGFRVAVPARAMPATAQPGGVTMEICPNTFSSIPMDIPSLTCGCSMEQAGRNASLWGDNPYMAHSGICRAARHAGAIGAQGGEITVAPAPKVPFFPSVNRNGIASASDSAYDGFRVVVPARPIAASPVSDAGGKPVQAPIAATLRAVGKVQVYINFATASARIEANSAAVLDELLATLRDTPSLRIALVGHTDSQGGANYNLDLSQRRAASVYGWLAQHGVDRGRLQSSGRGLLEPIADNDSDQGRALNRRVEVKALGAGS